MMMAATLAFVLQGMFVAASEAATGDSSHYYIGFVFEHATGEHHSHIVTHRHADGAIHTHAIDDDNGALAKHIKQPGWNMALVVCVVPCPTMSALSVATSDKLTIATPRRLRVADLNGLRRPPRPPSIA
jgi:ABC-type nickel/cobalt efflux system permease component RcnA